MLFHEMQRAQGIVPEVPYKIARPYPPTLSDRVRRTEARLFLETAWKILPIDSRHSGGDPTLMLRMSFLFPSKSHRASNRRGARSGLLARPRANCPTSAVFDLPTMLVKYLRDTSHPRGCYIVLVGNFVGPSVPAADRLPQLVGRGDHSVGILPRPSLAATLIALHHAASYCRGFPTPRQEGCWWMHHHDDPATDLAARTHD